MSPTDELALADELAMLSKNNPYNYLIEAIKFLQNLGYDSDSCPDLKLFIEIARNLEAFHKFPIRPSDQLNHIDVSNKKLGWVFYETAGPCYFNDEALQRVNIV